MLTSTQLHHGTFGAWCRRDGAHATKKNAYRNWNVELLEPVVGEIPRLWKPFDDNVECTKERCCLALQGMLDNVRTNLQGQCLYLGLESTTTDANTSEIAEDGVVLFPMDPFLESLTTKREELLAVLNRFSAKFEALSR